MESVVDGLTSDDGARTETLGDTERMRERIEPEYRHENHFDDHARWKSVKRKNVVCTTGPFLDGSDTSFDRRDVFVFATDV